MPGVAVGVRRAVINGAWAIGVTVAKAVRGSIRPPGTIEVSGADVPAIRMTPSAEPRAGTDEYTSDEVVRRPIAGGSTAVGRKGIVTISADWLRPHGHAHRTYANAHGDLRRSVSGGQKQNSEQSC